MKTRPRDLSEDELEVAREGKSEEVMGKKRPLDLSEDEVMAACEGKSEEVVKKKEKKSPK